MLTLNKKSLTVIDKATGKPVAFLSPNPDGIKNCKIKDDLNGQVTLKFILPKNSDKWQYIGKRYRIISDNHEFVLVDKEEERDENGALLSNVQYEESYIDLGRKFTPYVSVEILSSTAETALEQLLEPTDWIVGTVDIDGINDLETENLSCLANIWEVQKIWGGYLRFNSITKTVSLVNKPGVKCPVHARYGKNQRKIKRITDPNTVNRLICYGKDGLDLRSVNGGKLYVEDFSWTRIEFGLGENDPIPDWAIEEDIYINEDIWTPEELLTEGQKEVSKRCWPKTQYQTKMIDLREQSGYEGEIFNCGDEIKLYDPDFGEEWQLVISREYDYFFVDDCDLEIGDPLDKWDDKLADSFKWSKYLDDSTNRKGQISGYKLFDESVISDKIAKSAIDASRINAGIILLSGDVWTNAHPTVSQVSWNDHKVAWNGQEYSIPAGATSQKYIYFDTATPTQYRTSADTASIPKTAFIIGLNNSGIYEMYWNKGWAKNMVDSGLIAQAAVGEAHIAEASIHSAHIQELAVVTAHIDDLAVNTIKIGSRAVTGDKVANFIPVDEPTITYSQLANWSFDWVSSVGVKNKLAVTEVSGSYIQYSFVGDYIGVVAEMASNCGKVDIYVDNVLRGNGIDMYSSTSLRRYVIWDMFLAYGNHTVKVVLRSDKNPSSTGTRIYFNAFVTQKLLNFAALDYFHYSEEVTLTLSSSGTYLTLAPAEFANWSMITITGVSHKSPSLSTSSYKPKYYVTPEGIGVYDGEPNGTVIINVHYLLCKIQG